MFVVIGQLCFLIKTKKDSACLITFLEWNFSQAHSSYRWWGQVVSPSCTYWQGRGWRKQGSSSPLRASTVMWWTLMVRRPSMSPVPWVCLPSPLPCCRWVIMLLFLLLFSGIVVLLVLLLSSWLQSYHSFPPPLHHHHPCHHASSSLFFFSYIYFLQYFCRIIVWHLGVYCIFINFFIGWQLLHVFLFINKTKVQVFSLWGYNKVKYMSFWNSNTYIHFHIFKKKTRIYKTNFYLHRWEQIQTSRHTPPHLPQRAMHILAMTPSLRTSAVVAAPHRTSPSEKQPSTVPSGTRMRRTSGQYWITKVRREA